MKTNFAKVLLVFAALTAGCASTYSSIAKNEDGSYTLTKITDGFLRVKGSVFHCTGQGQTLNCAEIDTP
ncbi:MAG TPA: hypothetical protein VN853_19565 [Polyangia bacterium]|nr:hypothetical protein [Polyangia bacterium]